MNATEVVFATERQKLKLGPIEFLCTPEWDFIERTKLQTLFDVAWPFLQKYLGDPVSPGQWTLNYKTDDRTAKASCYGRERRLVLQPGLDDWVILHELVHVFHGERATHFDFFAEGIADAVAELVASDLGINGPEPLENSLIGVNASKACHVPIERPHWNRYRPLLALRTKVAARVWKEAEQNSPGFLHSFHLRLRNLPRVEVGPDRVMEYKLSSLCNLLKKMEIERNIAYFTQYENTGKSNSTKLLPRGMLYRPAVFCTGDSAKKELYLSAALLQKVSVDGPEGKIEFLAEVLNPNVPIQAELAGVFEDNKTLAPFIANRFSTGPGGIVTLPCGNDLRALVGYFPHYCIRFRNPDALLEEVRI